MTTSSENSNHQTGDANTVWREDGDAGIMENANSLFVRPEPKSPETATSAGEGEAGEKDETNEDGEVVPAKRYFDLKKHHDKVVSELRKELTDLKKNPDTSVSDEPNQNQENEVLNKFKESNPEDYERLLTLVRGEVEPKVKELEDQVSTLNEREAKIKRAEAKEAVQKAHPDLGEIVANDEFHYWAETQTKEIQNWIYDNPYNAELAIAAIDLWKAQKAKHKPTQDKEESQTSSSESDAAASLVHSRTRGVEDNGTKRWTKEDIKKMSVDEWEANRDQIYASFTGGR